MAEAALSQQQQLRIIQNKLAQCEAEIYSAEIDGRAATATSDKELKARATEAVARLYKLRDAYRKIEAEMSTQE